MYTNIRNGSKINELHGCYCGPFFGDTKKGPKPVDILDRLCRQHDIGYEKKRIFLIDKLIMNS